MAKKGPYYYVYRSLITGQYVPKWQGAAEFSQKSVRRERRLRHP